MNEFFKCPPQPLDIYRHSPLPYGFLLSYQASGGEHIMAERSRVQEITEAVIYCRVSTDAQAKSGLGLESQEARCRAWAEANAYKVAAVYVDEGAGAKTLRRRELEK